MYLQRGGAGSGPSGGSGTNNGGGGNPNWRSQSSVDDAFENAKVDIGGMDPSMASDFAERVDAFAAEFPDAASQVTSVTMKDGIGGGMRVLTDPEDPGRIAMQLDRATFGSQAGFDAQAAKQSASMAIETPTGVFDHELGHVLDYATAPRWGDVAHGDVFSDRELMNGISKYAATNSNEGFAEAFSIRQGGGELSPDVQAGVERVVKLAGSTARWIPRHEFSHRPLPDIRG
jgi:hypothetical protein